MRRKRLRLPDFAFRLSDGRNRAIVIAESLARVLAAIRIAQRAAIWGVRSVVVGLGVFGAPQCSVQRSPNTYF